jgi:tetratricopeptide (TPR) repeat protein
MKNVAEIQNIAESGDLQGAHQALDGLLSMGPRNLEALKLRGRLYEVAGQFQQEAKIWEQVAKIDRDDHDLMEYITRRQGEDRENFYFTDTLPGGGKRFIAFPRRMVRAATIGLFGCIVFLGMARMSQEFPVFNNPFVMLSSFALLVISPWIAIMVSYVRSLRYVSVTKEGIEIATRFKVHKFNWTAIEHVYLAQDDRHDTYQLSVVVVGRDATHPCFELDFNENTTPIRARSYFVKEIMSSWGEPRYVSRKSINTDGRPTIKA